MTASVVNASATPIAWNGVGGPITPGIPTDTTAGMLLLLPIAARTTGVDINLTTDYTLLSGDDDTGAALIGEIQGKVTGGSESAPSVTSTIVNTQPTGAFLLAITDWSGVIGDVFCSTPNIGTSQNVPAPDATALVDDTLVIRIYMQSDENTVVTPPTGHTQKFFQLTAQGSNLNMVAYAKDSAINSGVGAGIATVVMSGSDSYLAYTILVPPVGSGGGEVTLVVADTAQGQTSDVPTLTQAHVLSGVEDTEQGQTADSAALAQQHFLEAESTLQGQTAESPTLTQQHTLEAQNALQGQTAESPTLNAGTTLVIADTVQGQTSDSPSLTQLHTLTVQSAVQGQIADRPVLIQVHNLSVQDSSQGQHADVVTLTEGDITTPEERSITVVEESRIVIVEPEGRIVTVEAETRVITVTR